MLTVFLLTHKITGTIRIFWGYEKEKRVEEHVLNFSCFLTISYPSSLFRATMFGHNCICMPWSYHLLCFFFLIEKKKTQHFESFFFLQEIISQYCILLLHLKTLQKVYRSCTFTALQFKHNFQCLNPIVFVPKAENQLCPCSLFEIKNTFKEQKLSPKGFRRL